jgi:hypothetical protein
VHSTNSNWFRALGALSCVGFASSAQTAFAQGAAGDPSGAPPAASSASPAPPAASPFPPSDAAAPPAESTPPASSAAPATDVPPLAAVPVELAPVPSAPVTGSAAFAPLAGAPPEPVAHASAKRAPPEAPEPITPPPYDRSAELREDSPEPQKADDSDGIFGPFRIGFLLGTGLPDLVSLGGAIKITRYVGAGVNVGLIPTVKLSLYGQATISYQEYDAYGRIFPFGGAFFFGAGVGYATVHGTIDDHYSVAGVATPVPVDSAASVRTLVLTPQLGLLKTLASGFSIGVDVGAQLPIAPSQVDFSTQYPTSLYPAQYQSVVQSLVAPDSAKVRSTLNTVGRTVLPTIDFKIGWLF